MVVITMQTLPDELKTPLAVLLLSIADDKLMLGHRGSDWTGLAPILEEDIAFSAISQEEIAHASALYEMVGAMQGQRADAVDFGRPPEAYRCAELVTVSDEFDWARALVRQFFCDHFDILRFDRLSRSAYAPLAALAGRIHAEEATHIEHADLWMVQIGRGGDESQQRMQAALDLLSPLAGMLFEATNGIDGVKAAENEAPKLILMDIQLPDMDGMKAVERLKSNPATRNIPVVALTGYALKGDRERLLALGFDDYLSKPVDIADLLEKVTEWLKH